MPAIGAEVNVLTFTVPQGKNGVIQKLANQMIGAGWVEGTGDVVWRLDIDGVPAQGYNNIIQTLGTPAVPADLTDRPIKLRENQVITLISRNVAVAVAGQLLLGLVAGYYYPITQERENTWL